MMGKEPLWLKQKQTQVFFLLLEMLKRRFSSVSASGIPLEALIFDHLTLELPWVTKTEFLLEISMQY